MKCEGWGREIQSFITHLCNPLVKAILKEPIYLDNYNNGDIKDV